MPQIQRYQNIYQCDKPDCEAEEITYDHKFPKGWASGGITLSNEKGVCTSGNHWYACSRVHIQEAFTHVLNKTIDKEFEDSKK